MGIAVQFNDFPASKTLFDENSYMEPLFLNPDGSRKRFPIGWLGKGRYITGTLRIYRNGVELVSGTDFTEETNGIFFNFTTPPVSTYTCRDFVVSYQVRTADLTFSTNYNMFLFPRWRTTVDTNELAFWCGKNMASHTDATAADAGTNVTGVCVQSKQGVVPWVSVTRDNAITYCTQSGGHMIKNREYAAIIHWCAHHNIYPAGNSNYGVDGGGNAGAADPTVSGGTLCGTGPVLWNHNLQKGGIQDIVGNRWEWVPDLEIRSSEIYVAPANFTSTTLVDSGYTFTFTGSTIKYIRSQTALLEECIPGDSGVAVKGNDQRGSWQLEEGVISRCVRSGCWTFVQGVGICCMFASYGISSVHIDIDTGFRLGFSLTEAQTIMNS